MAVGVVVLLDRTEVMEAIPQYLVQTPLCQLLPEASLDQQEVLVRAALAAQVEMWFLAVVPQERLVLLERFAALRSSNMDAAEVVEGIQGPRVEVEEQIHS